MVIVGYSEAGRVMFELMYSRFCDFVSYPTSEPIEYEQCTG